ncbi:MAG: carbohydrate binding family 9 domain-containing protein, partial [bacterium]
MAIAMAIVQPASAQPDPAPVPPAAPIASASSASAAPAALHRLSAPIKIDGVLDDPGWQDIPAIDEWYETSPGNNTAPKVRTRGRVAYDGKALYVGLQLDDPDASQIRAPISDHDAISSFIDYAGIILDSANTGRTGTLFLVTPSGVQYDSVSDDSTGIEDASPDFFWDSAAHIDRNGWTLEIRIPFSSLSYARRDPQVFRFMLFRNYPRDFRYKLFTVILPRDSTCFICQSREVTLRDLPAGGSLVIAPYASAKYAGEPSGALGSRLHYGTPSVSAGFDAKWRPTAGSVVDVTVNPDFSQIES